MNVHEMSLVWNHKHADVEFGRLQARDLLQDEARLVSIHVAPTYNRVNGHGFCCVSWSNSQWHIYSKLCSNP